jgi:hypothetical protein
MEFTLKAFLHQKLNFIRNLYDISTEPFTSRMQKIAEHEAPYDEYHGDPECAEDPFQDDWLDAYSSVETLGACCLCLVHDALKQFMAEFFRSTGRTSPTGTGTWVERYSPFLLAEYQIDLKAAPGDLNILEQLALARNDLQHCGELQVNHIWQNAKHQRKIPQSIFVQDVGMPRNKMAIQRDSLFQAIEFVRGLGNFLVDNTKEPFNITYESPFDAFEQLDDEAARALLEKELSE